MSSLIQKLEGLGGGVFLTEQGVDSRVTEANLWRAFKEPVVIWVHGESFDDSCLDLFVEIASKFPHIRHFRFTSTRVTSNTIARLGVFWPGVPVEGVAT